MEARMDLLNCLDPDMSVEILTCLEDAADLVRFSCVSQFYRHFVIANGLCKKLCLRMFPELYRVAHVDELNKCGVKEPGEVGSSYLMEWEALERDHRVYASLAQGCTSFVVGNCILEAISASSTDNYPQESIDNTLQAEENIELRASYWSSKGQSNPEVPETLLYKLVSDICVITEINIRPFEAFFQFFSPIYSAKFVRFRMGHPKNPMEVNGLKGDSSPGSADDKFIWTYTSEQFPMAQENYLQKFKLPQPVLCIGGFLQIELLGRVQRQETDGLFYICMSHVQVVGRSLSPAFSVEIIEPSGNFVLKNDLLSGAEPGPLWVQVHPLSCMWLRHCLLFKLCAEPSLTDIVPTEHLATNYQHIVNMLYGNVENVEEYGGDVWSEEDETDEEYHE